MAVGKAPDEDIDSDRVVIRFGTAEVYPRLLDAASLEALSKLLAADEVGIHVSLGTGTAQAKVWGCDLSAEYVRINAEYTT
jgi:glutamate N-acetyltransferase/amino-acid N-acetyltransferase